MTECTVLGVMSGSSLDALDLALVRFTFDGETIARWELVATKAVPLPEQWKSRLAQAHRMELREFFKTDADFGDLIGQHVAAFIDAHGRPDVVASHGHTVMHHPVEGVTVQIGHPDHLAKHCPCPVITGLRCADVAAGGQGAPLAPVVEKWLFPGQDFYLNLGGIANLSFFPQDKPPRAWDLAPCNQLLNALAAQRGMSYDDGGKLARAGLVDEALLAQLKACVSLPLRNAFAMDNTWLRSSYDPLISAASSSVEDKLATICRLVADSVRIQMQDCRNIDSNTSLFVTGGGAYHTFLIECISAAILPAQVVVPDESIIDFKEAILIALCGFLRICELPNAISSVTGAHADTVNGQITL